MQRSPINMRQRGVLTVKIHRFLETLCLTQSLRTVVLTYLGKYNLCEMMYTQYLLFHHTHIYILVIKILYLLTPKLGNILTMV